MLWIQLEAVLRTNVIAISPRIGAVIASTNAKFVWEQKLGPLYELVTISEYHTTYGPVEK
jgi:hypothetical protein